MQADGVTRARELDEKLIRDTVSGDVQAFEVLVNRYFGMVYAIALARLGECEIAEEAAQEVFVRVYLRVGEVRTPHHFSAWLTRVTRNLAEDWARRGQRASRVSPMVPLGDLPRELSDPRRGNAREALERQERMSAIRTALARLPRGHQEVVLMHFVDDLTKAEIARRLEVHQSTVGRQLETALRTLRRELGSAIMEDGAVAGIIRPGKRAAPRAAALTTALACTSEQVQAAICAQLGQMQADVATVLPLKPVLSKLLAGGVTMGIGKHVAVVGVIALLAGGGYYYRSGGFDRTPGGAGIRPGQSGGLNAFTLTTPNGQTKTSTDQPPPALEGVALTASRVVELRSYIWTEGEGQANPLEQQLFEGKRRGELYIQGLTSAGVDGSVLYFEFPSEAAAQAGLKSAKSSDEGKGAQIRAKGRFVAVVVGGGNVPSTQRQFQEAVGEALDRQWGV